MQEFQVSATGHYVLSFVTASEMEVSTVTVARSRPARSEFSRARPVTNDPANTGADTFCFAEFVIVIFQAQMGSQAPQRGCPLGSPTNGPMQFDLINRLATVMNCGREQSTLS